MDFVTVASAIRIFKMHQILEFVKMKKKLPCQCFCSLTLYIRVPYCYKSCEENLKEENKSGFLKKHSLHLVEKQILMTVTFLPNPMLQSEGKNKIK